METKAGGKVARLPLDELNNYDGNPYGLAMDPKGRYLYNGVKGMHRVTILDMEQGVERLFAEIPRQSSIISG